MADLRDHEVELRRVLQRVGAHAAFAEVMAQASQGESANIDSKSRRATTSPHIAGAIIRAWAGARWVEASSSSFDAKSLDAVADGLERDLRAARSSDPPPGESSTTVGESVARPARPMREMGLESEMERARDYFRWSMDVPGIKNVQAWVAWWDDERFYLNTAGARCYYVSGRVRANIAAIAVENGRTEFDYDSSGAIGGQEILEQMTEERARTLAQETVALLHARSPPTGAMSVLLDGGTTGTFAHESFGHGTEADQFVRDRSYLKPILGQVVGPESLTIADDGSIPGAWGSIPFDDEGHRSGKTLMIDHGRFVGALHDRDSARALHAKATGNTRRSDFQSRAYVRMTNTYVEAGDWSFDELVQEAGDGVLLEHWTSGMEDPLGGQMQIKVRRGRRIEHGKLTDLVSSMALSGTVLRFLKDIRGVGNDNKFRMDSGFCGKGHGDYLPVGDGGPYLLSRAVVGPA